MKLLAQLFALAVLSTLTLPAPAPAAEAKKPKAAKTEAKKPKGKADGKADQGTAEADPAEVVRANEVLKELPSSKRTALTKLLNSGSKADLMALPGIGEATAEAILKARPLESAARLVTVKGVGEKTFSEIVKSRK
jgi:DNA uptake protein ComE-like DNA-binding protein